MHEYSIDVNHNKIIYYLAALSIGISTLITKVLNYFFLTIPFIEFTVSLTAISVFGLLYTLFDKFIWKWKWLNKIGVVQTPDLNGTWKGTFVSSFHDWKEKFPATLIIEQTWSEICISGKFNDSTSSSYTASIKVRNGGGVKVFYSYRNDKKPERSESVFSDHKGYGSLELNKEEFILEGQYFNNPSNNKNHGKLNLQRIS
ncbi:hypothetical protein MHB45_27230 [Peribacillus sp. FSL K6-5616]|uniref:Cap15 family cyclic dinucleotide receptor domain-containing protein n=1 Tax=Peribacillus TaxID=2675229 RepID=UPI0030F766D4